MQVVAFSFAIQTDRVRRLALLPGRLIFLLQFSDKGGQRTLVGRIVMIFVAKIEIEPELLQIVIVAEWPDLALCQPPKIGVSQLCR